MAPPSILSTLLSFFLVSHLSFNSAEETPSSRQHPCGFFDKNCSEGIIRSIQFEEHGWWYVVKTISYEEEKLVIQDAELDVHSHPDICTWLHNFTLSPSQPKPFEVESPNATFLRCERKVEPPEDHRQDLLSYTRCRGHVLYHSPNCPLPPELMNKCTLIEFPMEKWPKSPDPRWFDDQLPSQLDQGFTLRWSPDQAECFRCCDPHDYGRRYVVSPHPDYCGFYAKNCSEGRIRSIQFEEHGRWYVVKTISYEEGKLVIQDAELDVHSHPDFCTWLHNFTLPPSQPFEVESPNAALLRCERKVEPPEDHRQDLLSYTRCSGHVLYHSPNGPLPRDLTNKCTLIEFPMEKWPKSPDPHWFDDQLPSQLNQGFTLKWSPDQAKCFRCESGNDKAKRGRIKIIIGVCAGTISFFLGCLFFCSKVSLENPNSFCKRKLKDVENVEAFLKNYGSLIPRRYQYSELKKITNSFEDKLGQGGYGSVFKGKLSDGRLVAVKVLDQSKGSGEEFINEVASIGRTYHVNIVALLGFCFQGSKRALVYEFMPNGSLERFIYSEKQRKNHPLGWQKLSEIALGIARGLEYLHRGCNTRILHFDIKPHNVLLDKDFCPKISDFGLAKLCPSEESIISLLGARGTIGYIAPEVYCRNFGGVSSKSDVYSYGMMVLEMVGGRRNIDAGAENTSEIYFPEWIYKRLDRPRDFGLHEITAEAEEEISRKMIVVGLWCIQTDPRDRPSMGTVVEMLEGTLENLPVPPKPFLSSPTRPNQESSTSSLS